MPAPIGLALAGLLCRPGYSHQGLLALVRNYSVPLGKRCNWILMQVPRVACAQLFAALVACHLREIPSVVWNANLNFTPQLSICEVFARDLATTLALRIVSTGTFGHGCLAQLANSESFPRVIVNLGSDPVQNRLSVSITEGGKFELREPSAETLELATKIRAAIYRHFPDATITQTKLEEGILGP